MEAVWRPTFYRDGSHSFIESGISGSKFNREYVPGSMFHGEHLPGVHVPCGICAWGSYSTWNMCLGSMFHGKHVRGVFNVKIKCILL